VVSSLGFMIHPECDNISAAMVFPEVHDLSTPEIGSADKKPGYGDEVGTIFGLLLRPLTHLVVVGPCSSS
jgi:hypothetical protein